MTPVKCSTLSSLDPLFQVRNYSLKCITIIQSSCLSLYSLSAFVKWKFAFFANYTIVHVVVVCTLRCSRERQGLYWCQNNITVNIPLAPSLFNLTAALSQAERLSLPTYLFRIRFFFFLKLKGPVFPPGRGLMRRAFMLLICDLQTLCFLFFYLLPLLSSPDSSPSLFLFVVCPSLSLSFSLSLSLLFPNIFLSSSFSPPFFPSIPVLLWESGRNTFSHTAKPH